MNFKPCIFACTGNLSFIHFITPVNRTIKAFVFVFTFVGPNIHITERSKHIMFIEV